MSFRKFSTTEEYGSDNLDVRRNLIIALLVFSALMRLYPVLWGTPAISNQLWNLHADENKTSQYVYKFPKYFANGDSFWYKHPNFLKNPIGVVVWGTQPLLDYFGIHNHATILVLCRLFYWALGTLSVILTYWLASHILGVGAGVLSVLLLNLFVLHTLNSALSVPDVPTSFFLSITLVIFTILVEQRSQWKIRHLFLIGCICGASFFVKYNLLILMVIPLSALVYGITTYRRLDWKALSTYAGSTVFGLAFGVLVLNPESWLDTRAIVNSVTFLAEQRGFGKSIETGSSSNNYNLTPDWYQIAISGALKYVQRLNDEGVPYVVLLIVVVGVVFAFRSKLHPSLYVMTFILIVYVTLVSQDLKGRYLVTVAPVAAILGAYALKVILLRFEKHVPYLGYLLLLLLLTGQIYPAYLVYMRYVGDTRYQLLSFLNTNVARSDTVAIVWLDGPQSKYVMRQVWPRKGHWTDLENDQQKPDWVVLSSNSGSPGRGLPLSMESGLTNDAYKFKNKAEIAQFIVVMDQYKLSKAIYSPDLPIEFLGPAYWLYKKGAQHDG